MYSDTHFHFRLMTQDYGVSGVQVLHQMACNKVFFGLDIGTNSQDLSDRQKVLEDCIFALQDSCEQQQILNAIHYSAGIWPDVDSIHNRFEEIDKLKTSIKKFPKQIIAIGECGLDHHWNPSGVDGRSQTDFDAKTFYGEQELFKMQLEIAQEMQLPVIVHSRDAFEATVDCLKEVNYNNGIIHCFSYNLEQARVFLDMGWYIALGGAVTYTKKTKMQEMKELINFIPDDRLLLETDAPYLSPVPLRGTPNSPVNIEHTYKFIADTRGITDVVLSTLIDKNISNLFNLG